MPRFYIDISDNGRLSEDTEGSELKNEEEAREEAISVLPEIARDEFPSGDDHLLEAVVRTEDGQAIFRASLTLHCVWLKPRLVTLTEGLDC